MMSKNFKKSLHNQKKVVPLQSRKENWCGSSVWLEYRPVTPGVASSSLVRTAETELRSLDLDSVSCFIYRRKTPGPPPSLRLRSMLLRLTIPEEDPRTPSVASLRSHILPFLQPMARWLRSPGHLCLPRLQEISTLRIPSVNAERKMPISPQNPSAFTTYRPSTAPQV